MSVHDGHCHRHRKHLPVGFQLRSEIKVALSARLLSVRMPGTELEQQRHESAALLFPRGRDSLMGIHQSLIHRFIHRTADRSNTPPNGPSTAPHRAFPSSSSIPSIPIISVASTTIRPSKYALSFFSIVSSFSIWPPPP